MPEHLTFDQLMESTRLRSQDYQWDGVGLVRLHEISIKEALAREAEQLKAESPEQAASHGARWALRFLKGEFPSDDEVEVFQGFYSTAAVRDLYLAGCSFNGNTTDAKEEIEKN